MKIYLLMCCHTYDGNKIISVDTDIEKIKRIDLSSYATNQDNTIYIKVWEDGKYISQYCATRQSNFVWN